MVYFQSPQWWQIAVAATLCVVKTSMKQGGPHQQTHQYCQIWNRFQWEWWLTFYELYIKKIQKGTYIYIYIYLRQPNLQNSSGATKNLGYSIYVELYYISYYIIYPDHWSCFLKLVIDSFGTTRYFIFAACGVDVASWRHLNRRWSTLQCHQTWLVGSHGPLE